MIHLVRITPRRDAANRSDGWIAVEVGLSPARSAVGGSPQEALAAFVTQHGIDEHTEVRVGWTTTSEDVVSLPRATVERVQEALQHTAEVMRLMGPPQLGDWDWPSLAARCEAALAALPAPGGEE